VGGLKDRQEFGFRKGRVGDTEGLKEHVKEGKRKEETRGERRRDIGTVVPRDLVYIGRAKRGGQI